MENLLDYTGNDNHLIGYNGFNIDSNGKLGKCYTASVIGAYASSNRNFYLNGDQSFCLWVKLTAYSTSPTAILTMHNYVNTSNIGINLAGNRLSASVGYINGNRSWDEFLGPIINLNEWYHIILTYNLQENKICFYVNGVLTNSFIPSIKVKFTEQPLQINQWSVNYNSYTTTGLYNDVRVYDHTLSQKEAKDIYKTKICHYKFDNLYEESTENLFVNGENLASWKPNQNVTLSKETIDGIDYIKCKSNQASSTPGMYQDYTGLVAGVTYTVSLKIQSNDNILLHLGLYKDGADVNLFDSKTHNVKERQFSKTFVAEVNSYYRFYVLMSIPNTNTFILVRDVQLEKKDHYTPYVNGIRNAVISDSSDFHNDGTLLFNPITITNDSKIGSGALRFAKTHQSIRIPDIVKTALINGTISFWFKNSDVLTNWLFMNGTGLDYGNGSNYIMATAEGVGNFYHSAAGAIMIFIDGNVGYAPVNDGKWHLYTLLGVNLSAWAYLFINNYHSGWDMNGFIDDFRIYANQLTVEDIKELYETRAFIDDKGALFCEEIIEEYDDNLVWNGRFEDKSNKGFGRFESTSTDTSGQFISTDSVFGNGCMDFQGHGTISNYINYLIPINTNDVYQFDIWLRSMSAELASGYVSIICFDKDKRFLTHDRTMHYAATRTTLAADLKDGDTIVQLTSSASWVNTDPTLQHHTKQIGIFDHSEFRNYEVSRLNAYFFRVEGNTIILTQPWNGGLIKAGTYVANCFSGSTYSYPHIPNYPQVWTNYSAKYGPGYNSFRAGTKYVLFGISSRPVNSVYTPWRFGGIVVKNLTSPQNKIIPFNYGGDLSEKGILNTSEVVTCGMPVRYIRNHINGSTANGGNHWVQMEAYNEVDENIILGKLTIETPVAHAGIAGLFYPIYGGPRSALCNGNLNTNNYVEAVPYLTVDIGYITSINKIKLWHYYSDGRTYHGNKLEVSTDGVNWTTIFDSNADGEYAETSSGREFYLNPKEAILTNDGYLYCKQIVEN
jgi:hypothetical protein